MRKLLITILLTCLCSFVKGNEETSSSLVDDSAVKLVKETTLPPGPTSTSETNSSFRYEALEVIDKSPSQLIRLRGFNTETHYARTKDGYHIHLTRIINPMVSEDESRILKRPVIFNHGLLECSSIWLINARNVRPVKPSSFCGINEQELINNIVKNGNITIDSLHLNAPMMLSNYGYDVWMMDMRGTDWSLGHDTLSPKNPAFWDYSLDNFALIDVPTVIDYVRGETGALKVGYVGHSQATFSIFGLLSIRPNYADVVEPIVAVAPVSFFDHITSVGRILFLGTLEATDSTENGPFPWNAKSMRKTLTKFCASKKKDLSCQLIAELISGAGKKALKGYFAHLPFYTSLKVLRHFGQLINFKTNTMYSYDDSKDNLRLYGQIQAPSYPIEKIRSKSLCLISTKSDALSPPEDVERFKKRLRVPLYRDIFIDKNFNHMDMIVNPQAINLVNKPILEIFESFELISGGCTPRDEAVSVPEGDANIDHNLVSVDEEID